MQTNQCYDADSITAHSKIEDVLTLAAREQIIHAARKASSHRPWIAEVGHRLVLLGQWLQTMAHHPIYQEETV